MPGNLPLNNDPILRDLFRQNAATLFEEDGFRDYPHGGGSTDAGDLSQLMPVLHPVMAGAHGEPHSVDWHIADKDNGYVSPAKTLAMMAVDLLADDAGTGGAKRTGNVVANAPAATGYEDLLRAQVIHDLGDQRV